MSKSQLHSGVYAANSVAADTDLFSTLTPENSINFRIVALEINCSVAAKIQLNSTDKVMCVPDRTGFTARVNIGVDWFTPISMVKVLDACNVNSLNYYYMIDGYKRKMNTPVILPASGAVALPVQAIINADNDAVVYYTTNGDTPTSSSTKYTGSVEMESAGTLKAIAIGPTGTLNSDVASAVYTKLKVSTPTASPAAGEVESGTEVTLTCSTAGAKIMYKIGSGEEQEYTAPIEITEAVTITAHGELAGATDSDTLTAAYTIAE